MKNLYTEIRVWVLGTAIIVFAIGFVAGIIFRGFWR